MVEMLNGAKALNLEELAILAREKKVTITLNIKDEGVEVNIEPFFPQKVLTDTEVKPVAIGEVV